MVRQRESRLAADFFVPRMGCRSTKYERGIAGSAGILGEGKGHQPRCPREGCRRSPRLRGTARHWSGARPRCSIDAKTGAIKAFARLIVSDKIISKHDQIAVAEARRLKADAQIGDEVEVEVTPADFGRIAAQNARQAVMQQLRKAEAADSRGIQGSRGRHRQRCGSSVRTF